MAMALNSSAATVTAPSRDDANPYYINEAGGKKYAHHEALARCVGND
jgi:hypothetical protein